MSWIYQKNAPYDLYVQLWLARWSEKYGDRKIHAGDGARESSGDEKGPEVYASDRSGEPSGDDP